MARARGARGPPVASRREFRVTPDEPLSPTESRLVAAMASAPSSSQADIASQLKLSARHVRRLLAREPVRRALDAAARAGLREASSVLGRSATRAAEALCDMATGKVRATSPRVAAARAVIDGAS